MKHCVTISSTALLLLALCASDAEAQQPSQPKNGSSASPSNFQFLASGTAQFGVTEAGNLPSVPWVAQMAAVRALLEHVKPAETAAAILECPADKIVIVPRIFWREQKWLDWVHKANETRQSQPKYEPKSGPDDKIPLHVEVTFGDGQWFVKVELGP